MLKSLLSTMLIVCSLSWTFAQTRIIPHVTAPNGGFTTQVILENNAVIAQTVNLTGYDSAGNAFEAATVTINSQTVLRRTSAELFGADISHFTIEGSSDVKVNVAYDFAAGNSSPALVGEADSQGTLWRFFPGNWNQIFDGIAVVNTGDVPTDVWLAQKNDANEVVKAVKIALNLAPNGKALYVVGSPSGSEFSSDPSTFEVSGDQPLAVTALQGTVSNDQLNVLWTSESRPLSQASSKRDELGIWFIKGGDLYGAMERQGYLVAQDRLFQMEVFRRQARGTLGEIVSVTQISNIGTIDTLARQSGYSSAELDEYFANADSETQIMIQAYVDGINRRIGQVNAMPNELLPLEFKLLGESQVHDWDYRDLMAHVAAFQRGFSMRRIGAEQVENAALLQDLIMKYGEEQGAIMFNDMRYTSDPESQTMIEDTILKTFQGKNEQPLPVLRHDLGDIRADAYAFIDRITEIKETLKKHGMLIKGGSYAWAVDGSMTDSGNPMLYSGPQVGFSAPGLFVEGSIESDAITASGMSIPGIPAIIVGRTPHHAWSLQVGYAGTWDYYLEEEENIRVTRQETIRVKDGEDIVIDIEESDHGPILQTLGNRRLAFKYVHRDYNFELSKGLLNLARATNMDEFGEAVRNLAVSQHLCYVDKDGNIAYWHSGRQPVRQPGDYRVPQGILANQPVLEWDAAVVEDLQHERNPLKGYFGGWNNKPDPSFIDHSATAGFGPYHRGHAIRDFFQDFDPSQKWAYDEIRGLALSISATGMWAAGGNPWTQLGEAVIDAVNNNPTQERQDAIALFEGWDGRAVAGGPDQWALGTDLADPSVLLDAMIPRLIEKTFVDEMGPTSDTLSTLVRFQVFLHGLYERGLNNAYDWYTNLEDPTAPQTAEAIILETLDELLAELGPTPWGTGKRGSIIYNHVLFGNISNLGVTTPSPGAQRSTYAQSVEYDGNGPVHIDSLLQLGQSGTITGTQFAPVFDVNALNMKEAFDSWDYNAFPLFIQ